MALKKYIKIKNEQPASKNYFLGQGFGDIILAIRKIWKANSLSANKYSTKSKKYGIVDVRGAFWAVCAFSTLFFGGIFWLLTSILLSVYLIILFIPAFIICKIIYIIDRSYLSSNKIFAACPECKEKSLVPVYKCPNCSRSHSNLMPGKYGIFHRKCICGEMLPTVFFLGRAKLRSLCTHCGTVLNAKEAVPICIPVIGGRSVGKTAFITAFSYLFIENVAKRKSIKIEIYNDDKQVIYDEIRKDYQTGTTRMTARTTNVNQTSAVSFSFFMSNKIISPERLVHIYDIAGEVFAENDENEIQKQYDYCHGLIFMLDPLSIPEIRFRFEKRLHRKDLAGVSETDTNGVADTFLNKLHAITGLSETAMYDMPLAIALSKIDQPGISNLFDGKRMKTVFDRYPGISENDAQDILTRAFLRASGMDNFINLVDLKFKTNRFFLVSAIGHVRDSGEYTPKGVLEACEWIMRRSDKKIDSVWRDTKFSDVRPFGT